jgi:hypothetical protein
LKGEEGNTTREEEKGVTGKMRGTRRKESKCKMK